MLACLSAASVAFVYGCSSSSGGLGGSDDTPAPGGGDASTSGDASTKDSAPAPPPHLIFVTEESYSGDLMSAANGTGDAGDGGTSEGGATFADYRSAADALCQRAAVSAGKSGNFIAIIQANGDDAFARIKDSDGPWALADGTPVANTQSELRQGLWHASIDQTASGATRADAGDNGQNRVWTLGVPAVDCNSYSTGTNAHGSYVGDFALTGPDGISAGSVTCDKKSALYCAQVGSGAGPNVFPTPPAGAKIAFTAPGPYPGDFGSSDGGFVDASVRNGDAGADVHLVADEACNEMARGNGLAGKFHAWVSSSTMPAAAYFTSLSMNGPWVRSDGIEVAASLADLTASGARAQVELGADGLFLSNLGSRVWSGTNGDGGIAIGTNCSDYTTTSAASSSKNGKSSYKGSEWASVTSDQCSLTAAFYCFEE